MKRTTLIFTLLWIAALAIGSVQDADFWITPNQRGDTLLHAGRFADAAKAYRDPWRIATAQYRGGDFVTAAKTFARVPGTTGAFDRGNAWLMHGQYDSAIASYDLALGFRTDWREAEENKALALARKAKLEASSEHREEEQTAKGKPDDVVFDQKGGKVKSKPVELAGGQVSDKALRAIWLREVQTTPGDFLRAKFAYEAAHSRQSTTNEGAK